MDWFSFCSVFLFLSFLIKSFHLISFLIGLEMLNLFVLGSMFFFFFFFSDFFFFLFYLCVSACESALGLVLFVFFSRFYSKDYVGEVSALKF